MQRGGGRGEVESSWGRKESGEEEEEGLGGGEEGRRTPARPGSLALAAALAVRGPMSLPLPLRAPPRGPELRRPG